MSYKSQIEWLHKNHFSISFSTALRESSIEDIHSNGSEFKIKNSIKFIIQIGSDFQEVELTSESFVTPEDAKKERIPAKVIEKIRIGNEVFVSEKVRHENSKSEFQRENQKTNDLLVVKEEYKRVNPFPNGLESMVEKINSSILNFSPSHYSEGNKEEVSEVSTVKNKEENVYLGLEKLNSFFEKHNAIDKEIIKEFIDEEISPLKEFVDESEDELVKKVLRPLRRLIYREEAIDNFKEIMEEVKSSLSDLFKHAEDNYQENENYEEKFIKYKELEIDRREKNLKLEIKRLKKEIHERYDSEDRKEFIDTLHKLKRIEENKNPADHEKIKKLEKEILKSTEVLAQEEVRLNHCVACIERYEEKLANIEEVTSQEFTVRMRLVPDFIFEKIMDSNESKATGKDLDLQRDLNKALLNTSNPKEFLMMLQKFSGDEQDSIVYFAMKSETEKVDKLIDRHFRPEEYNEMQSSY